MIHCISVIVLISHLERKKSKALSSKILNELSSRFLSRTEFFEASLTSFFRNFRKVWNRTIFKNSECSETNFSELFDPKTGVLPQKTGNYFQTFFAKFLQIIKNGYFQKNSELRKTNFSETHKNEKFGNFRLTQGLKEILIEVVERSNLTFPKFVILIFREQKVPSNVNR